MDRQQNFKMQQFKMKGDSELLLLRVSGKPSHSAFLEVSGSQIRPLMLNTPLTGQVRNDDFKYQIYKLIFDKGTVLNPDVILEV